MADKEGSDEKTISQDIVVTKYKMAGEMVNRMSNYLISINYTMIKHVFNRFTNFLIFFIYLLILSLLLLMS
jgi:hypothetical protein